MPIEDTNRNTDRKSFLRLKLKQSVYLGTGVSVFSLRGVSGQAGAIRRSSCRFAASTVFRMSMATVMGPTPPGTGVT